MPPLPPPYQPPTEVAPGIYLVPIPIPIPLKYVNCFLCRGTDGWTLIDTGFHDALAEDAWPRAFGDLGIRFQDVNQILITHYHPDHLGGAGWLQQLTGAPARIHDKELALVNLFWGTSMADQAKALRDFFAVEGMPEEIADAIAQNHHRQFDNVQPLATLSPFSTGSRLRIGAGTYEVLWTPGHSDGLPVFWDEQTGVLFANDMLLNQITPNVSLWPLSRPNPLQDYIESLERVKKLPAKIALTGHRTMIADVPGRAAEIRLHHDERLRKMEEACGLDLSGPGATAWDVCVKIFQPERLTIHQVRFAMSETLAHLVYLEHQGRLRKVGNHFMRQ